MKITELFKPKNIRTFELHLKRIICVFDDCDFWDQSDWSLLKKYIFKINE